MTIHIVLNVVKLLIFSPAKGGLPETLSPKTIMSVEMLDFKKHLSLHIGQHYQVHEEDTPRNMQVARTTERFPLDQVAISKAVSSS
jgi:hypothetical protein